jgi:hypothetical protein
MYSEDLLWLKAPAETVYKILCVWHWCADGQKWIIDLKALLRER